MWKYRGFRTPFGGRNNIKEEFLKTFIVRESLQKLNRIHPRAKRVYNRMIQEPLPLTYKLKEIPEKQSTMPFEFNKPLGGTEVLPFQIFRTHTDNLPVYTDFKRGGTVKETIVRNIKGDVE